MTKQYYERVPVSELPEKSDQYMTNEGWVYYYPQLSAWVKKDVVFKNNIVWWLRPVTMTLDEVTAKAGKLYPTILIMEGLTEDHINKINAARELERAAYVQCFKDIFGGQE